MGREVKRVPLGFDWPLNQTWDGYLMPGRLRGEKCPDCQNGMSPDGELVQGIAYLLVGLADDVDDQQRGREMHPWVRAMHDISYVHGTPRPTERFVEFLKGLYPDDGGPGLGGRQPYDMARRLGELAGMPDKWDWCPTCHGHGTVEAYPGQRDEADAWTHEEPPTGDGWQVWETTSEGSPVTPVFATPEELADYCAAHVSVFGSVMADSAHWLRIIRGDDFAHVTIAPGVVVM